MNVSIIYATMSGHSRKIAKAVSEALGVSAYDVKEKPKLSGNDLLFIISGIYSSEPMPELLEFVKTLKPKEVKKVVLITSSTRKTPAEKLRNVLKDGGITVCEEEYTCFGGFLVMKLGHPNKSEISEAVSFAKSVIKENKNDK